MAKHGLLICADCGRAVEKKSPTQRYCPECSVRRDRERKRVWARRHGKRPTREELKARREDQKERVIEAGKMLNKSEDRGIAWMGDPPPELRWSVRVAVPFSYAASKNAIWSMASGGGHVYMRKRARAYRDALVWEIKQALAKNGIKVYEGKLWIDILVQKPDHRGDAVNVVDMVCDAVKEAVGIDDRWFSIRRLDWGISKNSPALYVGIGQEVDRHHRVCSHCGRILPLEAFGKRSHDRLGRARVCLECRRLAREIAKKGGRIEVEVKNESA